MLVRFGSKRPTLLRRLITRADEFNADTIRPRQRVAKRFGAKKYGSANDFRHVPGAANSRVDFFRKETSAQPIFFRHTVAV